MGKLMTGLVAALLIGAGPTQGAPAVIGPGGSPGTVRPWSVQYMDGAGAVTLAQAVAAAKTFGVIVAHPKVYKPYLGAMKAANPDLQLFVYQKGIFTYDADLPEDAYSHDVDGKRVEGIRFPGTFMMNPASPHVLAYQVNRSRNLLETSGYDGVFLDTLGPGPLSLDYVSSLPVNPATNELWTPRDWVGATSKLAAGVVTAIGKPVLGNGLRDGPSYWDPNIDTRRLLQTGMSGGMAEGWLRIATDPIGAYPSEAIWKQSVDAVVDAGALGASFCSVTKVWANGSQAQKDAWYKFALASFLLANDGTAYFSFSYTRGDATVDYPWNHLSLGAPTSAFGAYAKVDGVYQRRFSAGRVLVNPTTGTFTVALGATYYTIDGAPVTSVTLTPESAEILTL
jgi:hypothetical protein